MSLATATDVRDLGRIPAQIPDSALTPYLPAAVARLVDWVGQTTYDAAVAGGAGTEPHDRLTRAEAWLALADAITPLSLQYAEAGLVASGSIGGDGYSHLSPEQVDKLRALWLANAEREAWPYRLHPGTGISAPIPAAEEV